MVFTRETRIPDNRDARVSVQSREGVAPGGCAVDPEDPKKIPAFWDVG